MVDEGKEIFQGKDTVAPVKTVNHALEKLGPKGQHSSTTLANATTAITKVVEGFGIDALNQVIGNQKDK